MYYNRIQNSYPSTGISYAMQDINNVKWDSTKTQRLSPLSLAQADEKIRKLVFTIWEKFFFLYEHSIEVSTEKNWKGST